MRPPRPRITVRRLLVLIALVGIGLGGSDWVRRRRAHAEAMAEHHSSLFFAAMRPIPPDDPDPFPWKKWADYHLALEFKWRRAARRPWLPFEPDPPEPR